MIQEYKNTKNREKNVYPISAGTADPYVCPLTGNRFSDIITLYFPAKTKPEGCAEFEDQR